MNSLNILSARVSSQPPSPTRTSSFSDAFLALSTPSSGRGPEEAGENEKNSDSEDQLQEIFGSNEPPLENDEKSLLLSAEDVDIGAIRSTGWYSWPWRIASACVYTARWMISTILAPGTYIVFCLSDERGKFAPFSQIYGFSRRLFGVSEGYGRSENDKLSLRRTSSNSSRRAERRPAGRRTSTTSRRPLSSNSSSSGLSSDSELDSENRIGATPNEARHGRSKSLQSSDEIAPARRSIRIKLHNEDSLRQRKHRKAQSTSTQSDGFGGVSQPALSPATLKSPTSPAASLTIHKYPRAPAPPRPLLPRRQPSYKLPDPATGRFTQKTLIIDLDETLIHSLSKGGRMGTGHMVEVKLNTYPGSGGNPGPQHPILYYVHKRPHCDDFLRRVSHTSCLSTGVIY